MKLVGEVDFDIDTDLQKIKRTIEGTISSLAGHKPPGGTDTARIYFIEPPDLPLAVFDKVPIDLYIKIILARGMTLKDGSFPELIKVAGFEGDECVNAVWISIPSLIYSTLLLSEYLVTDLGFFHEHVNEKVSRLLSKEED